MVFSRQTIWESFSPEFTDRTVGGTGLNELSASF